MTADFSRASDRRSISNNLVEFVFFAGTKIWTCELHFVLCFRWWRCVSMFVVFTANVDNHRKYLTDKSFFRWEKKKQQQQIPFHKKCPKVSWPTNGRASFRTPFLLLTIRSAQAQRLQPLTPEMCVKLHDFVANKHHLMQEEYGSPAWRIQGRGPGGRAQTEARRAENLFLRPDPHPSRSVWPAPSPLICRSGSATETRWFLLQG